MPGEISTGIKDIPLLTQPDLLSVWPKEALTRPQTVVISERMALKYFGRANPMGKTLEINRREYEITGVVADPHENSHIKYDLIASLGTLSNWSEMSNRDMNN